MFLPKGLFMKLVLYVRLIPLLSIVFVYLSILILFCINRSYCFIVLDIISIWQVIVMYRIAYYSMIGDYLQNKSEQVDYRSKYETLKTPSSLEWKDVKLYYLLPNYKEKVEVMKATLRRISESNYVDLRNQVVVVLCMEGREEGSAEKAKEIQKAFHNVFYDIIVSIHPPDLPDELPGKGSNLAYGCGEVVSEHIKKMEWDEDNILVMCTDADMLPHRKFIGATFESFCNSPPLRRYRRTWGGPLIMDLNLYEVPVMTRVMSMMANNTQINFIGDPCEHISQSTFVISYNAVRDIGFWSPRFIAEDYHLYCKAKLHFRGKFSSKLVGLPIRGYNLDSGGYLQTMIDRWHQAKRHALGMVEIVFVIRRCLEHWYNGNGMIMGFRQLLFLLYHLSFHHVILMSQFLTLTCAFTALNIMKGIVLRSTPGYWFRLEQLLYNPYVVIFMWLQYSCSFPFVLAFFVHARYTCRKYWKKGGIVKYLVNLGWYSLRNFIELSIFAPFGMLIYGAVPTVYEATKLCFSENFDFFVAGKEGKTVTGD